MTKCKCHIYSGLGHQDYRGTIFDKIVWNTYLRGSHFDYMPFKYDQQSSPSLFKGDGQEVYKDFVFFLQKGVSVSNMTKIVVFGCSLK